MSGWKSSSSLSSKMAFFFLPLTEFLFSPATTLKLLGSSSSLKKDYLFLVSIFGVGIDVFFTKTSSSSDSSFSSNNPVFGATVVFFSSSFFSAAA